MRDVWGYELGKIGENGWQDQLDQWEINDIRDRQWKLGNEGADRRKERWIYNEFEDGFEVSVGVDQHLVPTLR